MTYTQFPASSAHNSKEKRCEICSQERLSSYLQAWGECVRNCCPMSYRTEIATNFCPSRPKFVTNLCPSTVFGVRVIVLPKVFLVLVHVNVQQFRCARDCPFHRTQIRYGAW